MTNTGKKKKHQALSLYRVGEPVILSVAPTGSYRLFKDSGLWKTEERRWNKQCIAVYLVGCIDGQLPPFSSYCVLKVVKSTLP